MKKFILTTPLILFFGMLCFTDSIEAAGCSSHKNKKVQVECSSKDDDCKSLKVKKNFYRVKS